VGGYLAWFAGLFWGTNEGNPRFHGDPVEQINELSRIIVSSCEENLSEKEQLGVLTEAVEADFLIRNAVDRFEDTFKSGKIYGESQSQQRAASTMNESNVYRRKGKETLNSIHTHTVAIGDAILHLLGFDTSPLLSFDLHQGTGKSYGHVEPRRPRFTTQVLIWKTCRWLCN